MKNYTLAIMATAFFVNFAVTAQSTNYHNKRSTPTGGYYWEYLPPAYNNTTRTYPTIIFLHGCGQMAFANDCDTSAHIYTADPLDELNKVLDLGPPKEINNGSYMSFNYTVNGVVLRDTFIVISPQINANNGRSWTSAKIEPWVKYVLSNYRVDKNRVYLTGLSLGAIGTYDYAKTSPAKYFADTLAAIAPAAGKPSSSTNACLIPSRDIPLWSFHGTADTKVSYSADKSFITSIRSCVPAPDPMPIFTTFAGVGHADIVWNTAYKTNNTSFTPNLYQWFLLNPRGGFSNFPPVVNAGQDISIVLPVNTVTISGTATDADGYIASYTWTQQSGPSTATLAGASQALLTVSGLIAGDYIFRLTATDNAGATANDSVKVSVSNPPSGGGWLEFTASNAAGKSIAMYYDAQKSPAVQESVRVGGNNYLHFYLKTITGTPNWNSLKVELTVSYQTKSLAIGSYVNTIAGTSSWMEVEMPLSAFAHDSVRWASGGVSLVNFKVASGFGSVTFGVDEILFTGGTIPFTWYGDSYDVSGSSTAVTENSTIFNITNRYTTGGAINGSGLRLSAQPTEEDRLSAGDIISIYNSYGQLQKTVTLTIATVSEPLSGYITQPGLFIFNITKPSGKVIRTKIIKGDW